MRGLPPRPPQPAVLQDLWEGGEECKGGRRSSSCCLLLLTPRLRRAGQGGEGKQGSLWRVPGEGSQRVQRGVRRLGSALRAGDG